MPDPQLLVGNYLQHDSQMCALVPASVCTSPCRGTILSLPMHAVDAAQYFGEVVNPLVHVHQHLGVVSHSYP